MRISCLRLGLAGLTAVTLAGCDSGGGGAPGAGTAAPGAAGYAPAAAVPTVQEAACIAAVAGRGGAPDVRATWTNYAVEGSTVYLRAAGQGWTCTVTNAGRVTGLTGPEAG